MSLPVSSIGSVASLQPFKPVEQTDKSGAFQNVLEGTIKQLESMHDDASSAVQKFLTGENEELHTTVLAVQKAEVAFDLGLQVRNKVISAYQEIMRMQM
jgi:flagellar hook-basal body complex protein FliE